MGKTEVRRQLEAIRVVLASTRSGALKWEPTGATRDQANGELTGGVAGSFTADLGRDSVLLERDDDNRVALHFMTEDRPNWADTFTTLGRNADPVPDEDYRDGLLVLLMDVVSDTVGAAMEQSSVGRITAQLSQLQPPAAGIE